jgi:hypothetical protein
VGGVPRNRWPCGCARGSRGKLARGSCSGVDQDARAVAALCLLTALAPARGGGFGGGVALQDGPARFFIAADHHATVLGGFSGWGRQWAKGLRFGIPVGIMAVEPVGPLVRREIGLVEETLAPGATERRRAAPLEPGRHSPLKANGSRGGLALAAMRSRRRRRGHVSKGPWLVGVPRGERLGTQGSPGHDSAVALCPP